MTINECHHNINLKRAVIVIGSLGVPGLISEVDLTNIEEKLSSERSPASNTLHPAAVDSVV